MSEPTSPKQPELVTVSIDGKKVQVPKGTNIIEAAKQAGIDIPHYCYHPHLSVAGNCRMCQISVKGQPKLTIACNTSAAEGMEVATHNTSKEVADAQAGTLEFILINHPLDCTVCDQAGHCKLQDYHFEYNARPSRFVEEKVHKPKALPLGPTVMLDGERCIMCTRCVRFCDEVTGTSELGMLNRGDQSVIAVSPGKALDNPLSGNVVDLCPVGALTHRAWRFNTRIWFTEQRESICPGCSTGCNVKVATRDRQVVHVKGRRNDAVNKEWLCDEGRYGFGSFLPEHRVSASSVRTSSGERAAIELAAVLQAMKGALRTVTVLAAPDLLLEEYYLLKQLLIRTSSHGRAVLGYRGRSLDRVQQILMSPDTACNFRAAQLAGLIGENPEAEYLDVLAKIRRKEIDQIIVLGDRAVAPQDLDAELVAGLTSAKLSVGVLSDATSPLASAVGYVVPGRSILEKSGLLLNRALRLQYAQALVDFPEPSVPEWRFLALLAEVHGVKLLPIPATTSNDRDVTRWYISADAAVQSLGLTIARIKQGGVQLAYPAPLGGGVASSSAQPSV